MKFLPSRDVLPGGTRDMRDRKQAVNSRLTERLLAIPGVSRISYGRDFIAVTKDDRDWQLLKPEILGAIMEHFRSGARVVIESSPHPDDRSSSHQVEITLVDRIRDALRQVIDPELGYKGVRSKLRNVSGIESLDVKLSYQPRWTPEMMSPESKAYFGAARTA